MKRLVKLALSLVYYGFSRISRGLGALVGRRRPARCVVLYYHDVPAAHRRGFARQMDDLVRWTTPIHAGHQDPLADGSCFSAVTFDDALLSVLTQALPELEQRKIPATIFAPSARLGLEPGWEMEKCTSPEPERVLSEDELLSLPQELVTIGSHTRTHPHLPQLDDAEALQELEESRTELEQVLGRDVRLFAFPYGEHDERTIELCRDAGYDRVFLISSGTTRFGEDEYAIHRVATEPDDWRLEFRLKLLGAYSWMPWASALKRRLRR